MWWQTLCNQLARNQCGKDRRGNNNLPKTRSQYSVEVWKSVWYSSGFHVRSECTVHEMLTATAASVCVSADLRASVHLRPADETVAENVWTFYHPACRFRNEYQNWILKPQKLSTQLLTGRMRQRVKSMLPDRKQDGCLFVCLLKQKKKKKSANENLSFIINSSSTKPQSLSPKHHSLRGFSWQRGTYTHTPTTPVNNLHAFGVFSWFALQFQIDDKLHFHKKMQSLQSQSRSVWGLLMNFNCEHDCCSLTFL